MIKINENWKFKEVFPAISAYTYVLNGTSNSYPFKESISSFAWVDELIVVDAGSTDGTREALDELAEKYSSIKIIDMPIDDDDPGRDGQMKSLARAMCSSEYCIQFDCDEICMGPINKWKKLAKDFPNNIDIVNLFVAEPFGKLSNLRMDKEHTIWKWRMSRNKPDISHGIPAHDRLEKDGKVYSKGMSDGCMPINIISNEPYPSFSPEYLRSLVSIKDSADKEKYKEGVLELINKEPFVLHVGHVSLTNKIKLYLNSWHKWWCFLYNKDPDDPNNNKYFPGVKVEEVTDEMIDEKVVELMKSTSSIVVQELEKCLTQTD